MIPPDEVVRLLETEMDNTPAPDDEDADEFDPALAVAWDPVPGALDDSAEQGVIGAASAVGNCDAAATASTAAELTSSGRTALLTRENTEVLLSRGTRHLMPPEATPRPKMLGRTERILRTSRGRRCWLIVPSRRSAGCSGPVGQRRRLSSDF